MALLQYQEYKSVELLNEIVAERLIYSYVNVYQNTPQLFLPLLLLENLLECQKFSLTFICKM